MGFRIKKQKNPRHEPTLRFAALWPASAMPAGNDGRFLSQFSVACEPQFITVAKDRDFVILRTGDRKMNITPQTLLAYEQKIKQENKNRSPEPRVIRLHAYEGPTPPADEALCQVKVVDEQGNVVPEAMIAIKGYDNSQGTQEAVMTNDQGLAQLHYPLSRSPGEHVRRQMSVDIPGHAIGPVPFTLTQGKTTVLTAVQGGSLSGVVTNSQGKPMLAFLNVRYQVDNWFLEWFGVATTDDGRFTIDQLMPNVPFRLHINKSSHQSSPRPEVWSKVITLKPGEHRTGLAMEIPQAAAFRGIIVNQQGQPVKNIYDFGFWNEHGGWGLDDTANDGRFGSYAVAPGDFNIKAKAKGYKPLVSQQINLKAGEMKFIKLVMEKE